MVQSHWLDPLARQLLKFAGQLPRKLNKSKQKRTSQEELIELEIEALRGKNCHEKNNVSFFVDVNRATATEWRQLPGCTEEMIHLLIRLQKGGVQLSGAEDLSQLLNLSPSLSDKWFPHLIFRWYGNAPSINPKALLDINCESAKAIKLGLQWEEERIKRLIRERQKEPFKNLADLQERMTLPASVIEELIGNVSFSPKRAGPTLPPKC